MSSGPDPDAVIVIFGASVRPDGRPSTTLRRRVEAAESFGRRFTTPLFLPTGAVGRYGASEASVMKDLLLRRGVPGERILLEETGTDTLSSVRAVRRLLIGRGEWAPVYVATSRFHLARCMVLLRLAGVPARAATPPPFPASPRRLRRYYWWIREAAALPYDTALMLWLRVSKQV
jgi:uncharacterized SAM-binding protein YcdF (DUF218 family)